MNIARIVSSLTIGVGKAFGKAAAASGSQMVKNFKYKPEGMDQTSAPSGSKGASSNAATAQHQMSIDEAHLILNVKKEDPMEVIQKNYDAIFAANGPKEPPTPATPANRQTETKQTGPKRKPPSHSHYLQSKVFRALERIKAERGEAGSAATEPTKDPAVVAAEALGQAGAKVAEGAKGEKTI